MNPIIKKSFRSAVLALGLIGAPVAITGLTLALPGVAQAATAPTLEEMKQTLASYGQFVTHAKHGEVWKPAVTPRGWHPYPACDWVYTKDYGWYFNDKSVWGAIVHHYGRWIHDEVDGWLWVPGAEFSPGWVVWRTSSEWVGWAPTPPDADLTPAAMEKFNDDKLWTFMDAKKFGSTCTGGVTVAQFGDVWNSTTYVTDVKFVGGIAVFVLPTWIVGPYVDVDINIFAPWSVNFIGSWVWNWTNIWNDIDINITLVKDCGSNAPKIPNENRPLIRDIRDNAPPPPPGGQGPSRRPTRDLEPNGERAPKRAERPILDRFPGGQIVDRDPSGRQPGGRRPGASFDPLPDAGSHPKRPGGRQPGPVAGGREPGGRLPGIRDVPGRQPNPIRDAGPGIRDFQPKREAIRGQRAGGDAPTIARLPAGSSIERVRGVRAQQGEARTFNRAFD